MRARLWACCDEACVSTSPVAGPRTSSSFICISPLFLCSIGGLAEPDHHLLGIPRDTMQEEDTELALRLCASLLGCLSKPDHRLPARVLAV